MLRGLLRDCAIFGNLRLKLCWPLAGLAITMTKYRELPAGADLLTLHLNNSASRLAAAAAAALV